MAEPRSPLVELTGHWRPIFADPERDYHYLTAIRSVRRTRRGARFVLAADDGNAANLALTFVRPEVIRVQLFLNEAPPRTTPMLVLKQSPPVELAFQANDKDVTVSSASLLVRTQRQPWQLSLRDSEGCEVFRQQRLDRALLDFASYPTGYSRDGAGSSAFHEVFALDLDEHLFGLGEQYGLLDKRGQRIVSWSREPLGYTSSGLTYLNIPFFVSSRGYGIFINHSSPITYELGWPSADTGAFQVDDPYLDYFLIYGPGLKDILARYGELTGRAPLPPLWSFGVWMSRCMYADRAQVEEVVDTLRQLEMPCDVVHVDPRWLKERKHHARDGCDFVWDEEAFPDPPGFVQWLADRGVRLCLWENPYVWEGTEMYEEGLRKGYLVRNQDGEIARPPHHLDTGLPDFTNPRAYRWWQSKHRPYLRMGVAAFKPDYGEAVPEDALFANGKSGRQMHNVYPLLYNRAVYEVVAQERNEPVVWSRSGYAGSQRYPINWTGDSPCTFAGMAAALRAGLSLSMSGIPFWSHDIGGFWNPDNFQQPSRELYIRWAQFGLLSSHARFHGVGRREPWFFGEEAVAIVREFARLRYRLLPYLYALAQDACRTGVPVVRPMFLEFPDDPAAYQTDLQYMLGPYLLVAPVFNEEGRCCFYLPPGPWYDFWTNQRVDGPAYREVEVPLERVPLFVRGESALPLAPPMDYVGQKPWEPIGLDVRVNSEAAFSFPDPERSVKVRAERKDSEVLLTLDGGRHAFEVRFLTPGRLRDVRFAGRASETGWEEIDGTTVVRLRAAGRCSLQGRSDESVGVG